MDEAYNQTRAADSKNAENIAAEDKILMMIDERKSVLRILSSPDSYLAAPLQQAGTLQEAVDIVTAEIEALQAIDPATVSPEQISEISTPYRDRLDALPRS